jgi:membrane protease YdiL (CAAX protease family)
MRPLRALGIYTLIVFLGGALIAPWLFRLVQALSSTIPDLADEPFHRYVSTTILIGAVAGLWPLLRAMGATSFREIGLVNPIGHGKQFGTGLLVGFGSLAIIGSIVFLCGVREFDSRLTIGRFIQKLLGAMLAAVVVGIMEEALFRGGFFGGLRRVFRWPFALLLSSMIYSITHFFGDAKHVGEVTWHSGLELLPRMFGAEIPFSEGLPRFINLTLAGLLLGVAYQRTGNLWWSIGLHAGWVFWLAIYRVITKSIPGATNWFWGSSKMIDGWFAFLALGITLLCVLKFMPQRNNMRVR